MNDRYGGAYDRGAADSYYRRGFDPHYYAGATYTSTRVEILPGTPEYLEYAAGYEDNEKSYNFKEWD
jgi:hypothetical protein